MPAGPPNETPQAILQGRGDECAHVDRLLKALRTGESRSLVVLGEAGIGKTALLSYLSDHAANCEVVRTGGVQSEMELPFAGLQMMCTSMHRRFEQLPRPQAEALRTVFGMVQGTPPDRFLIGLAVLNLLSEVAETQPLLCLVDDYQWLDAASRQVLAFVVRRLGAESVGMVFAARTRLPELSGIPELVLTGLPRRDARALLDSMLTGTVDPQVLDRIVAETGGNPLALLELTRGRTAEELAGGFAIPQGTAVTHSLEQEYQRRLEELPSTSKRLLLVAAADPTGDPALVWRAARRLDISQAAANPGTDAGLATFGTIVQFSHPLARSACYWSATAQDRQQAHWALAQETDPRLDPDRRSWHLAEAAAGPDEEVAAELDRSAERARARGGLSAAAAFQERAAMLTLDQRRRAERSLAAAMTKFQAGSFDAAKTLLRQAEAGPLSELDRARVDVLRAQLSFALSRGGAAPSLLLRAAERLAPIEPRLARETYLDAFAAATFAGKSASTGGTVVDVARAAANAPKPKDQPTATDSLLDGFAANFNDGYAAAVPHLRRALAAFGAGLSPAQELRWLWPMTQAALHLWDDERWDALSKRYLELAHLIGALTELPLALSTRAMMQLFAGDLPRASVLVEEQRTVTGATGSQLAPYSGMFLAAMRGDHAEASALFAATARDGPARGEGISIAVAEWTQAVLYNGLGEYHQAMAAAERALEAQQYPAYWYPGVANWAAAELVEAAARSGVSEIAAQATQWLTQATEASDTNWARGIQARSRALVTNGPEADALFRAAISWLEHTSVETDLARTRLLYGEWLRRERRRIEAREQLRRSHRLLEARGMAAFAERARRELLATGETARRRSRPDTTDLTAQEALIARLARDGMSNPEIATRLFISPRTVQYHLRKVFTKLGVSSRNQLDRVLSTS